MITALLVGASTFPAVASDQPPGAVVVTLFWGDGCPHCAAEEEFLSGLVAEHPEVVVDAYEVWYHMENQDRFREMAAERGIEASAVPTTFIGMRSWVGFNDAIGAEIEAAVMAELEAVAASSTPVPLASAAPGTIELPVFGRIDAAAGSLVATTALIALVDGFNPCSLWVLSVLLAMMLHSGSRRRMTAVGLTFLVVAGAAYGLFMLGLFAVLDWIGYAAWVQLTIAAIVGIFGIVAIKDYFWPGRGLTFSIPEERKPGITRRSRQLALSDRSLLVVLPLTAFLAAGVSLLELPCTAGFPVMWNGILADRGVAGIEFAGLLAIYLGIYLLDELILFGAALITMRGMRMQERHGRALKLVAGAVMVALALVMLVAPRMLDSISGAVAVFGAALGAAALVLVLAPRAEPQRAAPSSEAAAGRSRRERVKRAVH